VGLGVGGGGFEGGVGSAVVGVGLWVCVGGGCLCFLCFLGVGVKWLTCQ
jgi:hypothetical protein